jgi:hypothetical protein
MFTENADKVFIKLSVMPGRSSPDTSINPVKLDLFSIGIGSD